MAVVVNAMQLKAGVKVERKPMAGILTQPLQMVSRKDKTPEWYAGNLDYLEHVGIRQVQRNSKRFLKAYKLASGIIDRTDYIMEPLNEAAELIDHLTREDESAMDLKFFPIIPSVVNLLVGEFGKKNDKIIYRAVDDASYNEMLAEKRGMIEEVLVANAESKLRMKLLEAGADLESEEAQQQLSPENLKTLPEIEEYFRKDYRSQYEEWATHQHKVDVERFHMRELERTGFRDMLCIDREYWHFRMMEDDYEVELWNPLLVFHHKSPETKYISQGNFVGKFDLLTFADVIDKYGYMMTKEQIESLYRSYPSQALVYRMGHRYQNDGDFYDASQSHEWNTQLPGIAMRQHLSVREELGLSPHGGNEHDWLEKILQIDKEDFLDKNDLLRVTTAYWQSMRKVGHLTFIDEEGNMFTDLVDEDYKVTAQPTYNTIFSKEKSTENLIYGEHIDWIWIREVHGGIKIGPNAATHITYQDVNGIQPLYLDCKPTRFQFKGDFSLYGNKLPVEGCVFTERNAKSSSLVDQLKPPQVGFNLVNNQIADILIDELGTVVVLDQNALPRHSLGEDWGKGNFNRAYVAMKNFNILPLDTTISNTENPLNFNHYQVLNMEQTNRLLSRIQLANYFQQQAFQMVGISPQRAGQVLSQESAAGVEQAVTASYAQTEPFFIQHSEELMPRVHSMRTDLAQFYHSTRPSIRLQYMTSEDEKVNFSINGTQLLGRDLNVFCTTRVNDRALIEKLKQLAMSNNTAGATIYDLANVLKAESLAEITHAMKATEAKAEQIRREEQQQNQQLMEQQQQGENERQLREQQFETQENEKDREKDIRVAEIRAAGMAGTQDIDGNAQNDYIDSMKYLDERQARQDDINLRREESVHRRDDQRQKNQIAREKIQSTERISQNDVTIARVNKNQYDKSSTPKKKK